MAFYILYLILLLAPLPALATTGTHPTTFQELIKLAVGLILALIPLFIALAIAAFFWGVAQFMLHAGDSTKHKEGRAFMIYGIIGLFVLVSIWGIVSLAWFLSISLDEWFGQASKFCRKLVCYEKLGQTLVCKREVAGRIAMQQGVAPEIKIPRIEFVFVRNLLREIGLDPFRNRLVMDAQLSAVNHFPGKFA